MQKDFTANALLSLEKLIAKLKPESSTHMKSAVVALYTCDSEGKLRYSNLIGILQLDTDRKLKSKFLRIYDMDTLVIAFEVELYYGFQNSYRMISNTLYIFDYPKGAIGFLFRNKEEAQIMRIKIISGCPSLEDFQTIKAKNIEAAKKNQEKNTFFGKIKGFFGGEEEQNQKKESEVMNCKKLRSITFDLKTGVLNTENIPPEWQEIFSALKLSENDMKNKDIMGMIFEETVLNEVKRQADKNSDKDLKDKILLAERQHDIEQKQYQEEIKRNMALQLPPPPPPPPLLTMPNPRESSMAGRANLMDEIRNNKLKLNHVSVSENKGITVDISDMNKEERNDMIAHLQKKIRMRNIALNRRQASDDEN